MLRNFAAQLAGEVLGQLIVFFLGVYLARTLGAQGFGVWIFAATTLTYLTILVDGGTETWGTREISTRPERLRRSVLAILGVRCCLAVIALVLVLAIGSASPPERRTALLLGATSLIALALNTGWAHRGLELATPAIANLFQRLVTAGLILLFVHGPSQAPTVTLWQGLAEIAGALLLLVLLGDRLAAPDKGPHVSWRGLLGAAWPFGVARAFRGLPLAAMTLGLGYTWSNADIGQFGAATRVALLMLVVSSIFGLSTFPAITRACAAGEEVERRVVGAILRLLAILLIPITVGGVMLAKPLIVFVFTESFLPAVAPLQLLLAAFFLTGLTDVLRRTLQARHKLTLDLWIVITATLAGLVAAFFLIPGWGTIGAAGAVLVAELALFALVMMALQRLGHSAGVISSLGLPLVASTGMVAALSGIPDHLWPLKIAVGVVTYGLILLPFQRRILHDLRQLELVAVAPIHGA